MPRPPTADYSIEIDFKKGTDNPSRVFRAMTGLIETFQTIDEKLVNSIDVKIEPVLMLEDVEAGSLRGWFRSALEAADDEALKNLNWKPQVGKYLVRGKYYLIDFLAHNTTITDRKQITGLSGKLLAASEETDVKRIPVYVPIPEAEIVESLELLTDATSVLDKEDHVKYITPEEEISFNLEFSFSPDSIEELLTKETLEYDQPMILKVKKPDYLGESMWEFRFEGRSLSAKIIHQEWLTTFQERQVDVRPGDVLRAFVHVEAKYGYDGEVVKIHYKVIRVDEVIRTEEPSQDDLFDDAAR